MYFNKKIGIIGGGQLGKMMILPANLLGFQTSVFSNEAESPACIFANEVTVSDYNDENALLKFASECDFLTIEFESINYKILQKIEEKFPNKLLQNSNSVFISQNRLREKTFFKENGIKTAEFSSIKSLEEAEEFFKENGKFILKTTENGYDGKGQFKISALEDLKQDIPFEKLELIAEKFIPFAFEASIILTRSANGSIVTYPIPINLHKEGILHKSIIKEEIEPWKQKILEIGKKVSSSLNFIGTMAIEFFILETGEIIANEMAPRPHNSGHFTLDLCNVSQFENHIRAVMGLPIITPKLLFEGEMLNLIGRDINLALNFLDKPNAKLHLYGKKTIAEKRKMGHINFIYDEIFS